MECPVCYDAVPTVSLNCTHKMCQGCAEQWLQRNPTCPICRTPVSMQMENLSKAVSMALQTRERSREADAAARQAILDATPVLTLDMQADFDDEYAALDYDDYDYDDDYDAAYTESLRERWLRGRQPAEPSNIVGW